MVIVETDHHFSRCDTLAAIRSFALP